jgi:hypothetical protein
MNLISMLTGNPLLSAALGLTLALLIAETCVVRSALRRSRK